MMHALAGLKQTELAASLTFPSGRWACQRVKAQHTTKQVHSSGPQTVFLHGWIGLLWIVLPMDHTGAEHHTTCIFWFGEITSFHH
jgi:hypothetical protein